MAMLAKFRGKCQACGNWFGVGTLIARTEGTGWLHVECIDSEPPVERPALICQVCWLTIPCSCEEEGDRCDCTAHEQYHNSNL
jgi:hypothetical protein